MDAACYFIKFKWLLVRPGLVNYSSSCRKPIFLRLLHCSVLLTEVKPARAQKISTELPELCIFPLLVSRTSPSSFGLKSVNAKNRKNNAKPSVTLPRQSLHDVTVEKLREFVVEGNLPNGDRHPRKAALRDVWHFAYAAQRSSEGSGVRRLDRTASQSGGSRSRSGNCPVARPI